MLFVIIGMLILFIPMGRHGDTLAKLLFEMGTKEVADLSAERKVRKTERIELEDNKKQFYDGLSSRFVGALVFDAQAENGSWQYGYAEENRAWLDTSSGIIWRKYQGFTVDGWGAEQLEQARQHCQSSPPKGYWSLPTNAEFALAVKIEIQDIVSDIKGRWIVQMISHSFPFSKGMASIVGFRSQGLTATSVRCVARTEKAPAHGYIRDDISNTDILGLLTR